MLLFLLFTQDNLVLLLCYYKSTLFHDVLTGAIQKTYLSRCHPSYQFCSKGQQKGLLGKRMGEPISSSVLVRISSALLPPGKALDAQPHFPSNTAIHHVKSCRKWLDIFCFACWNKVHDCFYMGKNYIVTWGRIIIFFDYKNFQKCYKHRKKRFKLTHT